MSEDYLLARKAALLARANELDPNIRETIEQLAEITQALVSGGGGGDIDISTLAKEATLEAIKTKILDSIAVTLAPFNLTPDWRELTEGTTTIPEGSCYVYMKVKLGTATINGITKNLNQYINLESCLPARHPEITIVVSSGSTVELIRGY